MSTVRIWHNCPAGFQAAFSKYWTSIFKSWMTQRTKPSCSPGRSCQLDGFAGLPVASTAQHCSCTSRKFNVAGLTQDDLEVQENLPQQLADLKEVIGWVHSSTKLARTHHMRSPPMWGNAYYPVSCTVTISHPWSKAQGRSGSSINTSRRYESVTVMPEEPVPSPCVVPQCLAPQRATLL